jgi:hypothetical protein
LPLPSPSPSPSPGRLLGHFHEHLYDSHEQGLAAQQVFIVHELENGGGIENRAALTARGFAVLVDLR